MPRTELKATGSYGGNDQQNRSHNFDSAAGSWLGNRCARLRGGDRRGAGTLHSGAGASRRGDDGYGGARRRRGLRHFGLHGSAAGIGVALQTLQVGAKISSVLVAEIAIFLKGFVDDTFEFLGNIAVQAHGSGGQFVQDAIEDCSGGVSFEG